MQQRRWTWSRVRSPRRHVAVCGHAQCPIPSTGRPHLSSATRGSSPFVHQLLHRSHYTFERVPPPLQIESQVSARRLPSRTQSSYQAVSSKEVPVRHLQILPVGKGEDCISSGFLARSSNKSHIDPPFLRQGVLCVQRVALGRCLLFWVCWLPHPHVFTLSISSCVSFAEAAHDVCPLLRFTRFPVHHSFSVTSSSPGSGLLLFGCKKT